MLLVGIGSRLMSRGFATPPGPDALRQRLALSVADARGDALFHPPSARTVTVTVTPAGSLPADGGSGAGGAAAAVTGLLDEAALEATTATATTRGSSEDAPLPTCSFALATSPHLSALTAMLPASVTVGAGRGWLQL